MTKATDLATFQLNTNQIDQPINIRDIPINVANTDSQGIMERVDSPQEPAQGPNRAAQLQQFTDWLKTRSRSTHHNSQTHVSQKLELSSGSSDKIYRVDSASQPQIELQYQSPHFDTTDYVEAVEVDNSRKPSIPTDGFDAEIKTSQPERGIDTTIQTLKADGRVLGDSEQRNTDSSTSLQVPGFQWPEVSSNLLGSPAMLNLVTTIQQTLQTYRTQIVVASAEKNAGASTVALSLARELADQNQSVLLIDANLENPDLANQLGLTTQLSWTQAIDDGRPTNQLIIQQKSGGMSLLPLAMLESHRIPSNLFDQLATISNPLAWIYDYVVIDVGTVNQYIANSSKSKIRAASTLLVSDSSHGNEANLHSQDAKLRMFGIENVLRVQNFSRIVNAAKVG